MSEDTIAGSDDFASSKLLGLYQEKEVLSEVVEKNRARMIKDQADITKLRLLAARYIDAAKQRAKLLSDLEEQERQSKERIHQIKDEIKRLET
jgi:ribosomal protein L15